jgi:hypothetical protein
MDLAGDDDHHLGGQDLQTTASVSLVVNGIQRAEVSRMTMDRGRKPGELWLVADRSTSGANPVDWVEFGWTELQVTGRREPRG